MQVAHKAGERGMYRTVKDNSVQSLEFVIFQGRVSWV